jgi:hypothetical protein
MTALSVAGLHAGYDPDLPIVKGVSFDITRGEAVSHSRPQRRWKIHHDQGHCRSCALLRRPLFGSDRPM